MELDDIQTLRLVEKQILLKVRSFPTWEEFMGWVDGMGARFKAFVLQCIDDAVADGDAKKAVLLEIKKQNK